MPKGALTALWNRRTYTMFIDNLISREWGRVQTNFSSYERALHKIIEKRCLSLKLSERIWHFDI